MNNTYTQSAIPLLDLKRQYQQIKDEIRQAINSVLEEGTFTGGPPLENFETSFAHYLEVPHTVALSNGTAALHLAMRALKVGPGHEVIVPANTFMATALAPCYVGATPVFVDCLPDTWEIDPKAVETAITPRTKAVIGVHLYGQPFDVEAIQALAQYHGLFLIEDAAQAHGAWYRGKKVGALSDMACFSFYPSKNLGTYGEGGAVSTHSEAYAQQIRLLRNYGSAEKYYYEQIGFNYRMGNLEAAVLQVKLKYLDQWNLRRQTIAQMYRAGINHPDIRWQMPTGGGHSVYYVFVVTTSDRARLMEYLQHHGVFPGIHYPVPCHQQQAFAYLGYRPGELPNSEYLAAHCLSLPMYPELSDDEVLYIIDIINQY
ncbi:MAG: DegT/DnrJ/EryC1/StrS family aminotransferase [Bacteroidia bacterium]|nr:DegT/DnrJ/EryC1/StrS family aminotransferase [Bacteroidia bacterium]